MKRWLKHIIKKSKLYYTFCNWQWESKGKTIPPPHTIKQRTLKAYAKNFGLKILVETGTYYGDMLEAMKKSFDHIYSIELSKELYEKATERFKGVEHIELIHGDSGVELGNVMKRISQPALFWLDGHYSAGETAKGDKLTPIYEELDHILKAQHMEHVIIIDDAHCFGPDSTDYPSIEELTDFVKSKRPDTDINVQDNMIRITPKHMKASQDIRGFIPLIKDKGSEDLV